MSKFTDSSRDAMGFRPRLIALLLCCVAAGAAMVAAQTTTASRDAETNSSYPEQAYLSPSRYINQYFGFSFDLPEEARLHAVADPAAHNGNIQLLHLAGPPPADAEILIYAIPTAGKANDAKLLLREALDRELFRGVEELRGLSRTSFSHHQFYLFETRRGIEQHMILATSLGDYLVQVVLAAHDEKIVKRLETSFQHLVFFPPAEVRQYVTAEARPYDGPSISSYRLAVLEGDPPGKHIDPGKISGDFYENGMLGFSYRIPQGWSIEPEGAVQPAIERYRTKENFGRPRMGRVERSLVDACGRTLFSAWAKRPSPDGQVSYDEFGEVTISALSAACFPRMKFPEDANDRQGFKDFLAEFALTHPIVEDLQEGRVFTRDGLTFLFLKGMVAFQVPDDELSRRLSLGMTITQRRGYLLMWFFAAAHDQELRALTDERVSFDAGPPVKAANGSRPAAAPPLPPGGAAAGATTSTAGARAAASPGAEIPSTTSAASSEPGAAGGTEQSAATPETSSRPSLLRPGETMETQQGNGAKITKKK